MATTTATGGSLLLSPNLSVIARLRRSNHQILNQQPIDSSSPPKRTRLFLPLLPPLQISLKQNIKPQNFRLITLASLNPSSPNFNTPPDFLQISPQKLPFFSNSTKTLATLFSLSFALSVKIVQNTFTNLLKIKTLFTTPSPQQLETLHFLHDNVGCTLGPLFLASLSSTPIRPLNTPLWTAAANGMAKWLDIFSGVLMVRILLSWFPNMPWEIQPFSAIRDLCDPFLNLFRKIVPPIANIDLSPLLAFAVLGTLGSILGNARGV